MPGAGHPADASPLGAPALEGVRVVDLTRFMAGPFGTAMLGDYGADVLKVEPPGEGDGARAWGPPFMGGESVYFLSVNRNKRSLTLNLRHPEGVALLLKLVDRADVVVENFTPGTMSRLGIGDEVLRGRNPRLIYCAISGFGQSGPYRDRPAFDLILQGMGGVMSTTGEEGGGPVRVGIPIADIAGGMYAAYAIVLALLSRGRTGAGQVLDVSMMDAQISWLSYYVGIYLASGEVPPRRGSAHATVVPYQAFVCADGRYITLGTGNDRLFRRFCEIAGLTLADDPRFGTNPDRIRHRDELIPMLEGVFRSRPAGAWIEALQEAGVPCGPISTVDEIVRDPQVRAREMLVEIDHPSAGRITVPGLPIKSPEAPGSIRRPPPRLGEHTAEVLEELGVPAAELPRLRGLGVI
ncbi:MAG: formyl-CoA transferase [Acidobacteria bacterium 13_1_40CM_4_69_4]|nr:MAG: formyl-CoA transferase [Acidobacteria bacterium 13_1_40CM_4_69_4]